MKNILYMAVIATSGMTLFSYALSSIFKEKFLETTLLNQLVFYRNKQQRKNHPAGFAVHYGIGTFFSGLHYRFWETTAQQPGWINSSSLGFFNGLAGIAGWHTFFTLHPEPPNIKQKQFYAQLLAAHVVFGVLNGLVLKHKRSLEE